MHGDVFSLFYSLRTLANYHSLSLAVICAAARCRCCTCCVMLSLLRACCVLLRLHARSVFRCALCECAQASIGAYRNSIDSRHPPTPPAMQLVIKPLAGDVFPLQVSGTTTVRDLKGVVGETTHATPASFRLQRGAVTLNLSTGDGAPDATLTDYGVQDGDNVRMVALHKNRDPSVRRTKYAELKKLGVANNTELSKVKGALFEMGKGVSSNTYTSEAIKDETKAIRDHLEGKVVSRRKPGQTAKERLKEIRIGRIVDNDEAKALVEEESTRIATNKRNASHGVQSAVLVADGSVQLIVGDLTTLDAVAQARREQDAKSVAVKVVLNARAKQLRAEERAATPKPSKHPRKSAPTAALAPAAAPPATPAALVPADAALAPIAAATPATPAALAPSATAPLTMDAILSRQDVSITQLAEWISGLQDGH